MEINRSNLDAWLKRPRPKEEVLSRLGSPSNMTTEPIWVWLFNDDELDEMSLIEVGEVGEFHDGMWIEFNGDYTYGGTKTISGNIEDFRKKFSEITSVSAHQKNEK